MRIIWQEPEVYPPLFFPGFFFVATTPTVIIGVFYYRDYANQVVKWVLSWHSCKQNILKHIYLQRKNVWPSQFQHQSTTLPLVTTLSKYRGHGRAEIQQAGGLCQEVLCKAHGESLQHQSACTKVVNGLISAHYSDLLGTWVPFRALRAEGWGETLGRVRGTARKHTSKRGNQQIYLLFWGDEGSKKMKDKMWG